MPSLQHVSTSLKCLGDAVRHHQLGRALKLYKEALEISRGIALSRGSAPAHGRSDPSEEPVCCDGEVPELGTAQPSGVQRWHELRKMAAGGSMKKEY